MFEEAFKMIKAAKEIDGKTLKVGIPHADDIAGWNHDGTSRGIPPRKFEEQFVEKNEGEISSSCERHLDRAVMSGSGMAEVRAMGDEQAAKLREFVSGDNVKPKSSYPGKTTGITLYETGAHILSQIMYEIE